MERTLYVINPNSTQAVTDAFDAGLAPLRVPGASAYRLPDLARRAARRSRRSWTWKTSRCRWCAWCAIWIASTAMRLPAT